MIIEYWFLIRYKWKSCDAYIIFFSSWPPRVDATHPPPMQRVKPSASSHISSFYRNHPYQNKKNNKNSKQINPNATTPFIRKNNSKLSSEIQNRQRIPIRIENCNQINTNNSNTKSGGDNGQETRFRIDIKVSESKIELNLRFEDESAPHSLPNGKAQAFQTFHKRGLQLNASLQTSKTSNSLCQPYSFSLSPGYASYCLQNLKYYSRHPRHFWI